ncbi:hypothetical protein EI94DRAFT_869503 [Lactarius quietus]|nr:hypothetical protein EI94DRAFT_869503 [Lactarius quietus]
MDQQLSGRDDQASNSLSNSSWSRSSSPLSSAYSSRYIHLKEISVYFIKRRPTSILQLVFKDDAGVKHKSNRFKQGDLVYWNLDMSVHLPCHCSQRLILRLWTRCVMKRG